MWDIALKPATNFDIAFGSAGAFGSVLVGGAWKTVTDAYVLVGGAWKSVTSASVLVSGVWKGVV